MQLLRMKLPLVWRGSRVRGAIGVDRRHQWQESSQRAACLTRPHEPGEVLTGQRRRGNERSSWRAISRVYHSSNMKTGFIAVVLLTLIAPPTPHAQVRADELSQAVGQLLIAVDDLPPAVRPPQLAEAAQWLSRRVASTNPDQVSEDYLRSLRHAADLLKGKPSKDVIDDVTSELQAKVEHCRALGIGMGGTVTLKINTLRAGKPVPNLRVQALLKIFERLENIPPRNSARVSSPAEMTLDPGRYWLWAVDEATGAKSERVLHAVIGQKALLIDLTIP